MEYTTLHHRHPAGVVADATAAAPAAPGDRTPRDDVVVDFGPARERREGRRRDDAEQAKPALPRPQALALADAYNAMVAHTPLIPVGPLGRRECVALTQAIKHPAFGADIGRWRGYVLWATEDTFLRGEGARVVAADLMALTSPRMIDRWAASDRPKPADDLSRRGAPSPTRRSGPNPTIRAGAGTRPPEPGTG